MDSGSTWGVIHIGCRKKKCCHDYTFFRQKPPCHIFECGVAERTAKEPCVDRGVLLSQGSYGKKSKVQLYDVICISARYDQFCNGIDIHVSINLWFFFVMFFAYLHVGKYIPLFSSRVWQHIFGNIQPQMVVLRICRYIGETRVWRLNSGPSEIINPFTSSK